MELAWLKPMTQIFTPVFRLVSAALILGLISLGCALPSQAMAQSRIKDLVQIEGVRDNQ